MSQQTIDLAAEAKTIVAKYPPGRSRSALLPLLHRVQERDGHVTDAGMAEVAEILGLSTADVRSVATFYTMYYLKPKGRSVISVCHTIACTLMGAERVVDALESRLGIRCGQTTPDGAVTLERVECLAACDLAPMVQIDHDRMLGPIDPADVAEVISLANGRERPAPPARTVRDEHPVIAESTQRAVESEPTGSVSPERGETDLSGDVGPEPLIPDTEDFAREEEVVASAPISSAKIAPEPPEPPLLIDTIPLTPEEQELRDRLESRRGERRSRPSPKERLSELPPLEGGVGSGPETPQGEDPDQQTRPRGTE